MAANYNTFFQIYSQQLTFKLPLHLLNKKVSISAIFLNYTLLGGCKYTTLVHWYWAVYGTIFGVSVHLKSDMTGESRLKGNDLKRIMLVHVTLEILG